MSKRRGFIRQFMMGLVEGVYVNIKLNPQQIIKPMDAGRVCSIAAMFIFRWFAVACIFVAVNAYAKQVIEWASR